MSNTYRAPTEAETEAYKKAIDVAISGTTSTAEATTKAKAAIESVLGPCAYERLDKGKSQVTQCSPDKDGAQVRFEINADLA